MAIITGIVKGRMTHRYLNTQEVTNEPLGTKMGEWIMMLETYRLTNPCDKVWDIKEVEIRVMKNFGENVKYVLDIEWKEEDKNSMFGPFKPSVQWKLEFKSLFAIKNYYTKIFQPSNWCDKPKWIINN